MPLFSGNSKFLLFIRQFHIYLYEWREDNVFFLFSFILHFLKKKISFYSVVLPKKFIYEIQLIFSSLNSTHSSRLRSVLLTINTICMCVFYPVTPSRAGFYSFTFSFYNFPQSTEQKYTLILYFSIHQFQFHNVPYSLVS